MPPVQLSRERDQRNPGILFRSGPNLFLCAKLDRFIRQVTFEYGPDMLHSAAAVPWPDGSSRHLRIAEPGHNTECMVARLAECCIERRDIQGDCTSVSAWSGVQA